MSDREIDNTPKIPVSLKLLAYPSTALAIGFIVYTTGAGALIAFVMGLLSAFGLIFIRVFIRLISFRKFLKGLGEETTPSEHKTNLNIFGAVPFSSKAVALSTAPTVNGILVSRLGTNRFIGWEAISEIRNINFMGKPVLEVVVKGLETSQKIYIPWCKEANEYIPQRLHS
ncbi:hypothetical protein [Neptuniibacter caesariensis]|uniref:Uncharacterized protein n=1 Tax=Neptuniibacter caesariensis TaxID=207954 RepID=A0A7U8C613_NEPCE|nr:hypothetical protein [Neptuniibacter caesariensis]EAR62168.1 hypothetical protein MED92_10694 [Oceanospirillum sp. MED92] [Neptuniibacter caesariensis]